MCTFPPKEQLKLFAEYRRIKAFQKLKRGNLEQRKAYSRLTSSGFV
jgi:hypothetical protein